MDENRKIGLLEQDAFQFTHYIVEEAEFKMNGEELVSPMTLEVFPSVDFKKEEKELILTLRAEVSDAKKNLVVSLLIKGFFSYETKDAQFLRNMCLHNAPAILFPYVRAYISNITSLSGLQPVIIPTYMFTDIGEAWIDHLEMYFPDFEEVTSEEEEVSNSD